MTDSKTKLHNFTQVPGGYLTQFQNVPTSDTSDQGHHFAAFFRLGYKYSAAVGSLAAQAFEQGEAYINHTMLNTGDVNLGIVASYLGSQLGSGQLRRSDLANAIGRQIYGDPN